MKTIGDLREHLFDQLERLKKSELDPMDLERAKAVANVGKVIVDSAKVEVQFLRTTKATQGSGFIPASDAPALPAAAGAEKTKTGPTKVWSGKEPLIAGADGKSS
jgi:hypothetical protein